jgi:mannan endo-1,4-beta-mannosidase
MTMHSAPANPSATPAARAVLALLRSLETRRERRILSGQFTGFWNQLNAAFPGEIHAQSGQHPALIGVDYANIEGGSIDWRQPNRTALAHASADGLVTVSTHLHNPANPAGFGLRDQGVDLAALLDPETDTHRRWLAELDAIAAGLAELRDAGVPVLWRPFHEMNGGWFWWGAKEPALFHRVWRHLFAYFTETKRLDNLLWVYSPNHGADTVSHYPGDAFVDIVGLDAYTDDVDPEHILGGAALMALDKPFGFTEFGPHAPANPPGDYDYRRLLAGVETHFPRTVFFQCWDDNWSPARNRFTREFFADPRLLNRDALPPLPTSE